MPTEAEEPSPLRFHQEPDGTLAIDWRDGHQTLLAPGRLRDGCPCALCREERSRHEAAEAGPGPSAARTVRLVELRPVGRYGLSPVWSDGHQTGIYSWTVLRSLCDCVACGLERGRS
jgi:DUF971 family protein